MAPMSKRRQRLWFLVLWICLALIIVSHRESRVLIQLLTESKNADDAVMMQNGSSQYDICVVGAGLSGSVLAEQYASKMQKSVLVLDKRDHIGGNCYDYIDDDTGIRVSRYGAHLFHTKYRKVWNYVQQFGDWIDYEHKVRGLVSGKIVPIPVNIETVNELFGLNIQNSDEMDDWLAKEQIPLVHDEAQNSEQVALSRVGPRLYELIFRPYTLKQWNKHPRDLGPEVLSRIPVRNNHDDRYFSDPFQALPKDGYTSIFENMLSSPLITVKTNVDYFQLRGGGLSCGKVYYTGPIDTYFADTGWPKLEYRSLEFERVVENVNREQKDSTTGVTAYYHQQAFVVNHPQNDTDFTRIVEYKHLPNQPMQSPDKQHSTVYFVERSKASGEPYYPVPNDENKALYQKYQDLAVREPNVTFVGRLANYKYFNMDEAIKNALELFDRDTKSGLPHWCIIGEANFSPKKRPWHSLFTHFPHAMENILPCWSWFRKMNATSNCGFVLMYPLQLDKDRTNPWQKQLVDATGCQVRELNQQESAQAEKEGLPLSLLGDADVQHMTNLQLRFPRFGRQVYLDRQEDAHALRRLFVTDQYITSKKGGAKPLQIGLLQRTRTRQITNMQEIKAALLKAIPDAEIEETILDCPDIKCQARWFATRDVIVAAHGAALTNSIFVTPGTIVMQIYPEKYFWQSLDPLIEQSGGIALNWYHGNNPHVDWLAARDQGEQNLRREAPITPPVQEVVKPIFLALGGKPATWSTLVKQVG